MNCLHHLIFFNSIWSPLACTTAPYVLTPHVSSKTHLMGFWCLLSKPPNLIISKSSFERIYHQLLQILETQSRCFKRIPTYKINLEDWGWLLQQFINTHYSMFLFNLKNRVLEFVSQHPILSIDFPGQDSLRPVFLTFELKTQQFVG